MNFWTLPKVALALVSIGILLEPVRRRRGNLPTPRPAPPDDETEPTDRETMRARTVAPPELGLPGDRGYGFRAPTH